MNEPLILSETFNKIKKYLKKSTDNSVPVNEFKTPLELKNVIDFDVNAKGISENDFLELIDKYLDYSVKTGNKQFLNQLYSGFNFPAFIGEIFTALANTSMYTYEVAPVATVVETEMIRLMNTYTGYLEGDGIFVSGGSNANLVAMFSARNRTVPESRFEGYDCKYKLKAFISDQAHYSFETAANILGIGSNNVVKIKSDTDGKMIPAMLEKEIVDSINSGETPFFVAATCATTLAGAYDPIDEMAKICKKYALWLHADGSFGGSLILSDAHRYLMKGIEKTDSFTWNPHKLMNIPLICSAFLVKKRGTLQHNITDISTDYIFHDIDKIEDLGKKSIQCGRRVDAVKLWFAWKYFGLEGYQKRIDNLMSMAIYASEKVDTHAQLELLIPRQSFAVCFRYLPKGETDLNTFNLNLREALRKSGKSIVNFGYMGKTLIIRFVITNGALNHSDVDLFFNNLLFEAKKLEAKIN
ncbi:MAG: pyridoxal-dependent decarboxylase [Flavobacteriaceae bacterium]|nr:pyridoxal-dependent decarboxylase [Flavobacteriaceae bacterium]